MALPRGSFFTVRFDFELCFYTFQKALLMIDFRFFVYTTLILISLIIALVGWKYLNTAFRQLALLLFLTFIGEIYGRILVKQIGNSSPFYHYFVIVEHCILSIVYYHLVLKRFGWGFLWLCLSCFFVSVFTLFNMYFFQNIFSLPTNSILVSSMLLFFLGTLTLITEIKNTDSIPIYTKPVFWFNLGIILFCVTVLFIGGIINKVIRMGVYLPLLYKILYFANILMYFLYAVAICMDIRLNHLHSIRNSTPEKS